MDFFKIFEKADKLIDSTVNHNKQIRLKKIKIEKKHNQYLIESKREQETKQKHTFKNFDITTKSIEQDEADKKFKHLLRRDSALSTQQRHSLLSSKNNLICREKSTQKLVNVTS